MAATRKLFVVSFTTSKFAYYVWAKDKTGAINFVVKARPEFKPEDVENIKVVPQCWGIMSVALKENVF